MFSFAMPHITPTYYGLALMGPGLDRTCKWVLFTTIVIIDVATVSQIMTQMS